MGNIASITIKKGHLGEFFHNDRSKPTKNSIFDKSKNVYDKNAKEALDLYQKLLKERSQKYTARTGQKLQKNAITLLSAVVNIKETTTLEDLKRLAKKFEETYGTKTLQIAIHRDEGYVDEKGNKHINHHAHILFMGIDTNGYSVKKKFKISDLKKMQDWAAEILQMERGQSVKKTKRRRLDTYEYKEAMKLKNEAIQELKKDIKLDNKKINKYLKILDKKLSEKSGFLGNVKKEEVLDLFNKFLKSLKTQQQKLEQENEELKRKLGEKNFLLQETKFDLEKIKAKNDELFEKIQEIKQTNTYEVLKENEALKKENSELKEENKNLKITLKELKEELSNLRKEMIKTNKELEERNQEKIFDKEDYQYLSKLKKELKANNVKEVFEKLQEYKKEINHRIQDRGIDF